MKYLIVNDYDANDSFYIIAKDSLEAADKALEELGWWIAAGEPEDDNTTNEEIS